MGASESRNEGRSRISGRSQRFLSRDEHLTRSGGKELRHSNPWINGNARVEGHWSTTIRPIELRPDGDYSVHHGIRMSYKPKCQEGPCDVILTQPTYFGDVRQTLKRDGARYSGTKTLTGNASCYRWRLTVVVRVVGVADDGVSAGSPPRPLHPPR